MGRYPFGRFGQFFNFLGLSTLLELLVFNYLNSKSIWPFLHKKTENSKLLIQTHRNFLHRHCEPEGRGNLVLYEIASLRSQ